MLKLVFTGSFVASSGLESYDTHGFLGGGETSVASSLVDFVRGSLSTYSRSALPFVADAHEAVRRRQGQDAGDFQGILRDINAVDHLYDSMTLSHITRRASTSQGVALLTLYTKGFAKVEPRIEESGGEIRESFLPRLIDELKLSIRRDVTPGHLPICWGILTAALDLSLGKGIYSISFRIHILIPDNRTQSIPTLVSVRPWATIGGSTDEYPWSLRRTAVAASHDQTAGGARSSAMFASPNGTEVPCA